MKLFLDIDGVMVHANPHRVVDLEKDGFYKFNAYAVEILNKIIIDCDIEIILSTSHRFRFSIQKWKEIFQSRGICIENISIINIGLEKGFSRKEEIEIWILENDLNIKDLIIIDDDKSLNNLPDNIKERLVLTSPYVGLISFKEIEKILRKK